MIESFVALSAMMAVAQEVRVLPRTEDTSLVARSRVNTMFGPTGLIVVPSAAVVGVNNATFGVNFSRDARGPSINYGITQNVEIGANFFDVDAGPDRVYANAKLRIVPANLPNIDLAVGLIDIGHTVDQTFYVIASAFLTPGTLIEQEGRALRVHLGYGDGRFNSNIIGGAEAIMTQNWSLLGEWDGRNFNGGARYAHDENFRLQAGFLGTGFFVGATYEMRF
jgi:hypothetical protein